VRLEGAQTRGPDLVAQARFTYVPRAAALPVSTLALMLVLLLVLLLQVYLTTSPRAAPPAVPTAVVQGVRLQRPAAPAPSARVHGPSIERFTLVHTRPALPYTLVWQTRDATSVTLNGRPVAAQDRLALYPPLHSATYRLVAQRGSRRASAQ